ncbi:ocs element-binding factor 1 [Hordeum vulgare]|nr:ocs element-binding factor 1 [Hordeum vulgare]
MVKIHKLTSAARSSRWRFLCIRERRTDSLLESIRLARRCSMSARICSSVPNAAAMAAAVESEPASPCSRSRSRTPSTKQASRNSLLSFVVVATCKNQGTLSWVASWRKMELHHPSKNGWMDGRPLSSLLASLLHTLSLSRRTLSLSLRCRGGGREESGRDDAARSAGNFPRSISATSPA